MPRKHVVSLVSSSPGVGKSTLATSLAAVFSVERPVRLVEADRNGHAATTWPSPARVASVEEHDIDRLATLLEEPWEGLTLVDAPPLLGGSDRVIAHSELVIVPVSVAELDVAGTKSIVDACAKAKRRALVVLSLVDPRATAALRHAREALTSIAPLARNPFCQRTAYVEAAAAHVPITTHAPSSIAVSEVRALANEIATLLR